MSRTLVALSLAAVLAAPAALAAESANLTIYRSNSAGNPSSGHALVHETRQLQLQAGQQVVDIGQLPEQLDPTALLLRFPDRDDVQVLASRILPAGNQYLLASHIGEQVLVRGTGGDILAAGKLLSTRHGLRIENNATQGSGVTLVTNYAAVQFRDAEQEHDAYGGTRLQETVQAGRAGAAKARLTYPTDGLGWRASYSGVLQNANGQCRLQLHSRATIGNDSGRDWHAATLKLVAGEANTAGGGRPQMMMARSMADAAPAPKQMPEQQAMGAYRSYTIDGAIDLPDGSITQVPLYAPQTLDCRHIALYENGRTWQPAHPRTNRGATSGGGNQVDNTLQFSAFDNLPAGTLRVSGVFSGQREFLGASQIADTPKSRKVTASLGKVFVLHGERERTSFSLDKQGHTLSEAFRITLSNSGEQDRHVMVREHPDRWHEWELLDSSQQPERQTDDTLDFEVQVPAHGKTTLSYKVRYHWNAADEP